MTDEGTARVWVRGRWRLPNGREITRTAKREVQTAPDDMEHRLVVLHDFLEELLATGLDLPEGHGEIVEILGTMTD
jgi:hypothetical protein